MLIAAVPLAAALGGCVIEVAPTGPITLVLVNETALDVQPGLYISDSATDGAGLFVDANLNTTFTDREFAELRGNETITLSLECDTVLTIGVQGAVMFDSTQLIVTESDDQVFLLRNTDFLCEATVRLVYYADGDEFHVRAETS